MIDHQEAWQIYNSNGEPKTGQSIVPNDSRHNSQIIVGAVHVWIWRRINNDAEVLLQHRADIKPTWPGRYDISVAGHIDAGEDPLQAAVREGKEEIGIEFSTERMEYIFSYRNFDNGIKWVYLYEEAEPTNYIFNDGEVQALKWVKVQTFTDMVANADKYNLVPHMSEYFSLVVKALRHIYENH